MSHPSTQAPPDSPPLVTASQLPPYPSMSQELTSKLTQLINANTTISQLRAENQQLKEEINAKEILQTANISIKPKNKEN